MAPVAAEGEALPGTGAAAAAANAFASPRQDGGQRWCEGGAPTSAGKDLLRGCVGTPPSSSQVQEGAAVPGCRESGTGRGAILPFGAREESPWHSWGSGTGKSTSLCRTHQVWAQTVMGSIGKALSKVRKMETPR